jgi:hypothetical protein
MHLINLLYFFYASGNVRGSFTVEIACEGCSIDIETGCARGYIAGTGLAGDSTWDGSVYVKDDYIRKSIGPILHKKLESDVSLDVLEPEMPITVDRIVKRNFVHILKGFTDAVGKMALLHRFSVAYNADDMTYDNIRINGSAWQVSSTENKGFVTTPNCAANKIVQITSKQSGNDVVFIVSFDGGETWWTYSDGWIEPDYTQDVYGMFADTMSAITQDSWADKLTGQIMVQAILVESATLTDIQIYTEVM